MESKRTAGVLLHITSLPSKYGVGTLGKAAYDFVDWLESAGMKIWQVLPLVPTNYGDSPYQSVSSTALNYYLIDLDILNSKGLLKKKDYENIRFFYNEQRVEFSLLFSEKIKVLRLAFSKFNTNDLEFIEFIDKGIYRDFAIFMTIKSMNEYKSWELWPEDYKKHSLELEEQIIKEHTSEYLFWLWTQYEFLHEWNKLHEYAKQKNIEIMGDMPLYVAYDSVEVWKNPELFVLTENHERKLVAGCPPDAFSDDGQLWGNPIYDWKYMKKTNYAWWNERIKKAFELYDILRIDHFRGFDRYYAIPAEDSDAKLGKWQDGPKFDLFRDKVNYKIVAEDLGYIDEGVRKLLKETNYPGMKVLSFAFDGNKENEHKPSNCEENYVIYTGTHDNMPIYQYILDLGPEELATLIYELKIECKLLNFKINDSSFEGLAESIVELAFASKPNTCIVPMQDLLCQDGSTRMNFPSTVSTNNWSYRITKNHLSISLAKRLLNLVEKYNRR